MKEKGFYGSNQKRKRDDTSRHKKKPAKFVSNIDLVLYNWLMRFTEQK